MVNFFTKIFSKVTQLTCVRVIVIVTVRVLFSRNVCITVLIIFKAVPQ